MIALVKEYKGNEHLVSMTVDKDGVCSVAVYTEQNNNMYGYPEREIVYSRTEKKNAEATYRRYVKKYCKGE